jgi:hypothetical protein
MSKQVLDKLERNWKMYDELSVTGCVVRPKGVNSIQDLLQGLVIFDWTETLDLFGC